MTDPAFRFPDLSDSGVASGFYPYRLGDIDVLVLNDGGIPVPRPPGTQGDGGFILRPLNCLLVRLPGTSELVLMDAGYGPNAKRTRPLPTLGRLQASLAAVGIAAEDIGTVLITHIHPDHVEGLYGDDGTPTFPNAVYRVGAEELAFWSQPDLDLGWSSAPAPLKVEMLATVQRFLGFAGDTLQTFRAGEAAIPGIGTILLPGHTPGQVGFVLSSGGERLLNTADAITTVEGSIDAPERKHPLDLDPELGIRTRLALLDMLSQPGWHSFSPHFPWPNLGTVHKAGDRYQWTPVE